jgi:hypothetical protein
MNEVNSIVNRYVAVCAILSILLTGCGSATNTEPAVVPGQANPATQESADIQDNSHISGLWNLNLVYPDGTVDERSLKIPSEGATFTLYDYEGDIYGSGQNCYTEIPVTVDHVSDSEYLANGYLVMTFSRANPSTLFQTTQDIDDEDGDGDTSEFYPQSWTLITEITTADYSLCGAPYG